VAWESWIGQLRRRLGREVARRRALADMRQDAARMMGQMVRLTIGDSAGPLGALSDEQWLEAFEDLFEITDGIARLEQMAPRLKKVGTPTDTVVLTMSNGKRSEPIPRSFLPERDPGSNSRVNARAHSPSSSP
jgi:hypothetical protein